MQLVGFVKLFTELIVCNLILKNLNTYILFVGFTSSIQSGLIYFNRNTWLKSCSNEIMFSITENKFSSMKIEFQLKPFKCSQYTFTMIDRNIFSEMGNQKTMAEINSVVGNNDMTGIKRNLKVQQVSKGSSLKSVSYCLTCKWSYTYCFLRMHMRGNINTVVNLNKTIYWKIRKNMHRK